MKQHEVAETVIGDRWVEAHVRERREGEFYSVVTVLPLYPADTFEAARIEPARSLEDAKATAERLFGAMCARIRKAFQP